jgi:hypothetical protein
MPNRGFDWSWPRRRTTSPSTTFFYGSEIHQNSAVLNGILANSATALADIFLKNRYRVGEIASEIRTVTRSPQRDVGGGLIDVRSTS